MPVASSIVPAVPRITSHDQAKTSTCISDEDEQHEVDDGHDDHGRHVGGVRHSAPREQAEQEHAEQRAERDPGNLEGQPQDAVEEAEGVGDHAEDAARRPPRSPARRAGSGARSGLPREAAGRCRSRTRPRASPAESRWRPARSPPASPPAARRASPGWTKWGRIVVRARHGQRRVLRVERVERGAQRRGRSPA